MEEHSTEQVVMHFINHMQAELTRTSKAAVKSIFFCLNALCLSCKHASINISRSAFGRSNAILEPRAEYLALESQEERKEVFLKLSDHSSIDHRHITVWINRLNRSRSDIPVSVRYGDTLITYTLNACAMHCIPTFNHKEAVGLAQTLINGYHELLFFGSGSGLGRCRLGKKYLTPALSVVYFASRG